MASNGIAQGLLGEISRGSPAGMNPLLTDRLTPASYMYSLLGFPPSEKSLSLMYCLLCVFFSSCDQIEYWCIIFGKLIIIKGRVATLRIFINDTAKESLFCDVRYRYFVNLREKSNFMMRR